VLSAFDEECPRDENSITKRDLVTKALGLEKAMSRNKKRSEPYATILESMLENQLRKIAEANNKKEEPKR